MLKSYVLIAIRNILREKFYSLLNIFGLAIGIASVILIGFWLRSELSYDRHFQNHERIFRVESSLVTEGVPQPMVTTDRRLAGLLREKYRHVCEAVSIYKTPTLFAVAGKVTYEEQAVYADDGFFQIFSFEFVCGDPGTALTGERSVVITESRSRTLFGDRNPIGREVNITNLKTKDKGAVYVVTGVIRDSRPNSHFHPAAILRKTGIMDTHEIVYIMLHKGYTVSWFAAHVWQPLYLKYMRPHYIGEKQDITLDRLQPLADIHLGGSKWEDLESNSDRLAIYVFASIGFLILIAACINYVNLATARSSSRAREIGMRKVLGASRSQVIIQFLMEAVIISLISLLVALSLAEMSLPLFNRLTGSEIVLDMLDPYLLGASMLLALIIGILSGLYPAFYISSFLPAATLKGDQEAPGKETAIRSSLVILQFSISIFMLIAMLIIGGQLRFMKKQRLGFDTERVVVVDLDDEKVNHQQGLVKKALLQNSNVLNVSMSHNIPGGEINNTYITFETPAGMHGHLINSLFVDPYYVKTMGLKLKEGRDFDSSMVPHLDTTAFIIINESAKKFLGYDKAVGKKINTGLHYGLRTGEIIGVIEDFHASGLHQPIKPLVLGLGTLGRPEGKKKFLTIKLRSQDIGNTLLFIEKTYKSFGQGYPFHYRFMDQAFNAQYAKEEKQKVLFGLLAGLSIFSSLLGLMGLASFVVGRRAREIAVRRVSGAGAFHIAGTLVTGFVRLTVMAWLIAAPVSWLVMHSWLSLFAYHTYVGLLDILLPGVAALLLVIVVVVLHTWIAVRKDPASVLRYE
jgi:putative ABC transport system permease protein